MEAPYILTHSGKKFHYPPRQADICIEDIAHALSRIPRFLGHMTSDGGTTYSVAQHSVAMSHKVESIPSLVHDGSETYGSDLPSPLKALCGDYRWMEKKIEQAIAEKFGFTNEDARDIKYWDRLMCAAEAVRFNRHAKPEMFGFENDDERVWDLALTLEEPWDHETAERKFLERYEELSCKTLK